MRCTARITILASRLAAGVVNFDSSDDVVISAAVPGAPVSSTRASVRVVRGPGVYGIVNVPFQVAIQGSPSSDAAMHVTPSTGVVSFLDRQVGRLTLPTIQLLRYRLLQSSWDIDLFLHKFVSSKCDQKLSLFYQV